jgi:hypothetical protein
MVVAVQTLERLLIPTLCQGNVPPFLLRVLYQDGLGSGSSGGIHLFQPALTTPESKRFEYRKSLRGHGPEPTICWSPQELMLSAEQEAVGPLRAGTGGVFLNPGETASCNYSLST